MSIGSSDTSAKGPRSGATRVIVAVVAILLGVVVSIFENWAAGAAVAVAVIALYGWIRADGPN